MSAGGVHDAESCEGSVTARQFSAGVWERTPALEPASILNWLASSTLADHSASFRGRKFRAKPLLRSVTDAVAPPPPPPPAASPTKTRRAKACAVHPTGVFPPLKGKTSVELSPMPLVVILIFVS